MNAQAEAAIVDADADAHTLGHLLDEHGRFQAPGVFDCIAVSSAGWEHILGLYSCQREAETGSTTYQDSILHSAGPRQHARAALRLVALGAGRFGHDGYISRWRRNRELN